MAKLYFRHGVMGSSKSTCLLTVAHNYKQQGKFPILMKPKIDSRTGDAIYSRTGLEQKVDLLIEDSTDIINFIKNKKETIHCILVDESQFLSVKHVQQLRDIATFHKIPCICYGLRTNYQAELFEGSKALFCLADSIEEVKNTCWYCNKKAIMNLKLINGKGTVSGNGSPDLGFEDKYIPVCYYHYTEQLSQ